MFSIVVSSGCYAGITGKVIDAQTQQPIEGAVVLVEWTKTKGLPGMSYTESAKVIEVISDKEGKIEISGNINPFVNPPHVTVYKKGYVAWNNEYIFPDYSKRTDFKWENGCVFKLEHFKQEYSYDKHVSFISGLILSGPLEKKKLMLEAIKWEEVKAFEERRFKK
jgi:hypothetical protein